MSNPDYYDDYDPPRRHRSHRHRDRPTTEYKETTYVEQRDSGPPRKSRQQMELIRSRDDSDVEEVERDFPPGGDYGRGAVRRDDRYARRTRSVERNRGYDSDDDYYATRSRAADSRRSEVSESSRGGRGRHRDEKGSRTRSASRGQELAGAATGAGLAVGAKELWDRREGGKGRPRSKSKNRLGEAALGVAGAVAGDVAARQYGKRHGRRRSVEDDRSSRASKYEARGPEGDYYAETDYESYNKPAKQSRRKSLGEAALGALGLGAAAKAGGGRDRDDDGDGDRRRRRRDSFSSDDYSSDDYSRRSRSRGAGGRSRGGGGNETSAKIQQAAQAALTAAAAEAWRSRKEPGGILDPVKARRILTAAAGAGGIDALADRHPDDHSKRNLGEGAIGGLLLNRLVNGSKKEDFSRAGRSRSRGSGGGSGGGGGGGLKELATAALAAGAGKKILDQVRSRSKSRPRSRRYSSSSSDSRSPPPRARRSRSVSAMIDRGMAKLGMGEAEEARQRAEGRVDRRGSQRDVGTSRSLPRSGGAARGGAAGQRRGSSSGSESDFSLSEEEKSRKKMRGKELLTAGLATVATVHAAHEIYESMEKRDKRRKAVLEGQMSPAEAKRAKSKATVQDLAAVGIAGLGIKGAVSTWKEMKEQRDECREIETKLEKHRRLAAERQAKGIKSGKTNNPNDADPYSSRGNGYGNGPMYQDGNPYAAGGLPPPPSGPPPYQDRRH